MIAAGIDTHKDFHILALTDELGREISHHRIPATHEGALQAARLLGDPEGVIVVGIEGAGSYGASISRHLAKAGYRASEVCRPARARRRPGEGKSDPADALRAARDALARLDEANLPKSQDGYAECCRMLRSAHRSAVKARTAHMSALKGLIVSAPDEVRKRLDGLDGKRLIAACARKREGAGMIERSAWSALRAHALLWRAADAEAGRLEAEMEGLLEEHAPALLGTFGVGCAVAAELAAAAGDNPERMRKGEASFAALCGASPVEASSGKHARHRLNRGGNRQANSALHTIALVRMRYDAETRAYVGRRTAEGRTKREIMRCLKRAIAREVYKVLLDPRGEVRQPRQRRG